MCHHSHPRTRRPAAWWCKWGPARRCNYPELSAGGGWHRWRADRIGRSPLSWTGWSPRWRCQTHSAAERRRVTALNAWMSVRWRALPTCVAEIGCLRRSWKTAQDISSLTQGFVCLFLIQMIVLRFPHIELCRLMVSALRHTDFGFSFHTHL